MVTPPLDGDFDGDFDADGNDFLVWQREVGNSGGPADVYRDGVVDWFDMAIWHSNFGKTNDIAGQAAVPEPTAACYAAVGLLAVVRRRNRY